MNPPREQLRMRLESFAKLPEPWVPLGYEMRMPQPVPKADYRKVIEAAFGGKHDFDQEVAGQAGYLRGGTVLAYHQGQPVATATALRLQDGKENAGYLHMVGVLSQHAGRRLGEAVSMHALGYLKRLGYVACDLETDDFRLPAIVTYLRLGFVPVIRQKSDEPRWHSVLKKVGFANFKSRCQNEEGKP